MGRALCDRSNRTHERGHCAELRGPRRARAAILRPLAVRDERVFVGPIDDVVDDDLAFDPCGVGLEIVVALDDERFSADTVGRRGGAAAQGGDRQLALERLDDLGALAAADPVLVHHFFRVDVVEAVAIHLIGHPRDRALQVRAAAEARREHVGELREPRPRTRIRRRLRNDPARRRPIRLEPCVVGTNMDDSQQTQTGCNTNGGDRSETDLRQHKATSLVVQVRTRTCIY